MGGFDGRESEDMAKRTECSQMQSKYIPFLDNELKGRELEGFLEHLHQCQDCREEYDIYYTMMAGIRYLEDDMPKGSKWLDSREKLEQAEWELQCYKLRYILKISLLACICILVMFLVA